MGLGWDETVYVSQVAPHIPTEFFSAPRSRGITLLVAPLAAVTDSTVALRCYLAVLSGLGLFLALAGWRRLRDTRVLALAGGIFASLWITQFYGPEAMPNLWTALSGLAAVGCFLDARRRPGARAPLVGLAAALAFCVLMRLSDAAFLALPLVVAAAVDGGRRRLLPAVLGGLLAGAAEWIAEAYARFGGIGERLHLSSLNEGGLGLHWAVGAVLRSLDGPILCRPCDVSWSHKPLALTTWWWVLPLLVIGGVLVERRAGRGYAALLPAVCGLTAAVPYLFLITYAAPRFLLPAYALLSVPAASLLARPVLRARPGRRRWPALAVALVLGVHVVSQAGALQQEVRANANGRAEVSYAATQLARLGLTGDCLLTGADAEPLGYYTRCRSVEPSGNDTNITLPALLREAGQQPTGLLLVPGDPVPSYARNWPARRITTLAGLPAYTVYLAPR